jgi:hypothetical protein
MSTIEELHIYNAFKSNPNDVLNEKLKYNCNVLFYLIVSTKSRLRIDPRQQFKVNRWG